MKLYFIALIPEEELRKKIKELKEEMADKFGASHALKSPAHITLQPPLKRKEEEEPDLIKTLERFSQDQSAFQIQLAGFGFFPKSTIFIKVANHDPVINLYIRLHNELKEKILGRGEDDPANFHPHVTIATRDLTKKAYKNAIAHFEQQNFKEKWQVQSIFLLKHNGKNWDIHREIPFKNS